MPVGHAPVSGSVSDRAGATALRGVNFHRIAERFARDMELDWRDIVAHGYGNHAERTLDHEAAPEPEPQPINTVAQRAAMNAPVRLRPQLDEVTSRRLDRSVREMRARKLSYPAIAVVLDLYEGLDVTDEEVRAWCHRVGSPKNPRMARA